MVTGGATGIGAAVATGLARAGLTVVICDVNETTGRELAAAIKGRFIHAAEVIDLLFNGSNGEIRVKSAMDQPAFGTEPPVLA